VTFAIRKASTEDARAIVEVLGHAAFLKDCYRGEAGISLVKDNIDMIWVADLDGQVVSVMLATPKYDFGYLEVHLLVTRPGPEFEGHGFARALTHKAKRLAADCNLDLIAYAENEKSKSLLISEHFKLDPDGKTVEGFPRYRFQRENH
jgi:hypothetical protein